jgi:phosphatidylglycerophosphatase A
MRRLAVFICSFGYIGFFPIAPGSVGAAAGLMLHALARSLAIPHFELPLIVALFLAGVAFTPACERDLQCTDPGPIVIDEVMGMLITLAAIPVGWGGMILGFFVFRAFDVAKPFPARQLERLHGGLGVMSDDVMAGIYANLTVRGAYHFVPGWLG